MTIYGGIIGVFAAILIIALMPTDPGPIIGGLLGIVCTGVGCLLGAIAGGGR